MRVLDYGGLPTSLGEIINIKYHLDQVKTQYDQIKLSFHTQLWNSGLYTEKPDWPQRKKLWDKYLFDLGQLFFKEPPYILQATSNKYGGDAGELVKKLNITPQKAEMAHLLCKGKSLNLGEEYIVITTKLRHIQKNNFFPHLIELLRVLNRLSKKYKIVILGERIVEMRKEYVNIQNEVFGIYEQIITNLPNDRIVDLTVPALGETVSDLKQIQQDCLIMNEAKFVITLGVGGNSCMAHSTAKMSIGYREDNLPFGNIVFGREYPNLIVSKDWKYFISVLERYLK